MGTYLSAGVLSRTRTGVYRRGAIAAVIPAYNEAAVIRQTIEGIKAQTMPPDWIIVVPNNCTDDTTEVVRSIPGDGVYVKEYPGRNAHRKAGALNWALKNLLPELEDDDFVLVTDADSKLEPEFIRSLWLALRNPEIGAACATFYIPEERRGLLAALQRNEYVRFARQIERRNDRAIVLSGVGTMFPVHVLRELLDARAKGILPGYAGEVYHRDPATEDIEITFAVQALGYKIVAPHDAVAMTDTMPTWRELGNQRVRWQRGMLDSLKLYGIKRYTYGHMAKLIGMYLGSVVVPLYFVVLAVTLIAGGDVAFDPRWLPTLPIFIAERVVTVWRAKTSDKWLALVLLPEWVYEQFRSWIYWKAIWLTLRNAQRSWINA